MPAASWNWLQLCYQSRSVNNFDCLCVLKGTTQPGSAVESNGYQRRHPNRPRAGPRGLPWVTTPGPHTLAHRPLPHCLCLLPGLTGWYPVSAAPSVILLWPGYGVHSDLRAVQQPLGQQPCLLPWGLTGERSVRFSQGLREQQLRKLASGRGVHQPQPSFPGSSGFLLRRDVSAFSVRCKRNWTWLGFLPDQAEATPEQPAGLCSGVRAQGRWGAIGSRPSGDRGALPFLSEEWGALS